MTDREMRHHSSNEDSWPSGEERWLDLVAAGLSGTLTDVEHSERSRLAAGRSGDLDAWEWLAGDVALASAAAAYEPLPDAVRQRLRRDLFLDDEPPKSISTAATRSSADMARVESPRRMAVVANPLSGRRDHMAWLVAAACLLVAVLGWMRVWDVPLPQRPSVARSRLLAKGGADVVRADWAATEDPSSSTGGEPTKGDVSWDVARQEGYMRFRGLAVNDPAQEQYQLWIFDAERDERYPVDGGVFDITDGTAEVIVPIRAAIAVRRPVMFAVTVEKPGGVVVSSRERLPLIAKVE